jgi:drug/metabolite transporter (DMT)-like permease
MQDPSKTFSRGFLIAIIATILWSFTGILISYLSKAYALPSLVLAFWRDLFVSLGLVVVFLIITPARLRLGREYWLFMVAYGLILAFFNSMWTFSVQFNGAAVATVLAFSSPAMTAILARFILKEQLNIIKVVSIFLSLAGTTLVSGVFSASAWQVNAAGITFGLLTGFFFACYNMMGKTASNKSIDSWTSLLFSFLAATAFLFLFNLISNTTRTQAPFANFLWLGTSVSGWSILFFLGVVPTVGGFGLYSMSLGYLPATVANLIATLEPALTAIWAYFLLNEQLTTVQLAGSLLIFSGVIFLRLGEERRTVPVME